MTYYKSWFSVTSPTHFKGPVAPSNRQYANSFSSQLRGTQFRSFHKPAYTKRSVRQYVTSIQAGDHKPHKEKLLKTIAAEEERERCLSLNFGAVMTHTSADFDSLAAAVGLARLRDHEQGMSDCTVVVMPQGANPTVQHFLALHKHFYPIKVRRNVDPQNLTWLAVVDGQRKDRFGPCAEWLDICPRVEIFDHHVDQTSDIPGEQHIEPVGSVTTMIVERLEAAGVRVSDTDATLLALGIHSDTGSLLYECTTERDVHALAYCLSCGASQKAIMQFSRVQLSVEQRTALNEGLLRLELVECERVRLGFSHVQSPEYIPGAAMVARELMQISNLDVLILACSYIHKGKKNKKSGGTKESPPGYQHVSLIGRGCLELECVNISKVLTGLNGGGHPKAAATTFRMDKLHQMPDEEFSKMQDVESLLASVVDRICRTQIPPVKCAVEFMTPYNLLVVCHPDFTVNQALEVISRYSFRTLPVVGAKGELQGVVSLSDLEREKTNGLGERPVTSCMQRELYLAKATSSLPDIEGVLVEKAVGSLPVVQCNPGQTISLGERCSLKEKPRLVGFITRTDVLREHAFYGPNTTAETLTDLSVSFLKS